MLAPDTDATNKDSFYHGGHWGQCLELLTHLCQYSDSILLVTGPVGIGKTSLKQALINNNKDNIVYCELQAKPNLTTAEAIDLIDREFDIALRQHQTIVSSETPGLLLLVDNAQDMPLSVISILLQLNQTINAPGNLHVVLFAEPEFEQSVQKSTLQAKFTDQVHTIEIEPLTLSEVEKFLEHSINLGTVSGSINIDKNICKKIYSLSGGVPGEVLNVADEILNGNQVKNTKTSIKRWSPFSVGLTVAFGIIFCLLAFLWPVADDNVLHLVSVPNIDNAGPGSNMPNLTLDGQDIQTVAMDPQSTVDPAMLNATPFLNNDIDSSSAVASVNDVGVTAKTNYDNHAEQLARLENKLIALQQQLDLEKEARNAAEKKAQQIMSKAAEYSKPRIAAKVKVSKNTVAKNRHEKYILSLPSKNYTLQLLGSSSENKVKQFILEHKINADAYYFKCKREGQPWFVVIFGNFPNRTTASNAVNSLPPSLKKLQPWAREFSSIQSSINSKS